MLKKTLSSISILAIFSFLIPSVALAADIPADLIQSVELTVDGANKDTFNPTAGQSLKAKVNFTAANEGKSTTGYIKVLQGTTTIKTLKEWTDASVPTTTETWDGKAIDNTDAAKAICGSAGAVCPNGDYKVEARVQFVSGGDTLFEVFSTDFKVITVNPLAISSFTIQPETADPSSKGANQTITFAYALNQEANSLQIEVKDAKGTTRKIFNPVNKTSGSETWDGKVNGVIAEPGTYTATLTASKTGANTVTQAKTFNITYSNSGKSLVQDLKVTPDAFDPDTADAVIDFKISQGADVTVEIRESTTNTVVRTFEDYKGKNYSAGSTHSVTWNGKSTGGSDAELGNYRAVVVARNDFGVSAEEKIINVNNSGGSISTANDHIDNISFSPSSTFEPAVDDELEIQYDVQKDLDGLKIYAIRGNEKIELADEGDLEEENNREITWDGTDDDDDYVAAGTWKIQFESKIGGVNLVAAKNITVEYEKPEIDDVYVSKSKFDNDIGEFTYVMFRVDAEADVTIQLLESNQEEDDIVEDMEVEADRWYAVSWDGESYDVDDDLEFKIIAENPANESVFDSETIDIDLTEDDVIGNKANITNDYISPVLTDGNGEMEIHYDIDKDADIKVTIHKGTSSSSSTVAELADLNNQDSGEHTITWNGRDDDGDKLTTGVYTYKIVSSAGGTDSETGLFIVGPVGDAEEVSDDDDDDDDDFNGGNPNVIIDGGSNDDDNSDNDEEEPTLCGGFKDVQSTFKYCEAIEWAQDEGIFKGYSNGTFGPNLTINRVEMLKTILEAFDVTIPSTVSGNLGFVDVDTNAWYMTYLKVGKEMGIMAGDGSKKTVRPGEPVNRAEAAKVVLEGLKTVGKLSSITCGGSTGFSDVTTTSAWYFNYVCVVGSMDLIDDVGGNFVPTKPFTRAEMAEMLFRLNEAGML